MKKSFWILLASSLLLVKPLRSCAFVSTSRQTAWARQYRHVSRSPSSKNLSAERSNSNQDSQSNRNQENPQTDLLHTLDESFDYQGRMPSNQRGDSMPFRCGYVSIVGAPNMGKSTLMNALIQEDLCVATRRPQTTRHAIMGVMTTESCQLCLVDTPGIIDEPAYKLQEGMMEAVMGAFRDADVVLVVTDVFSTPIPSDDVFEKVKRSRKPILVVINKVDLVHRINPDAKENEKEGRTVSIEEAVAKWRSLLPQALAILPISAEGGATNAGVIALRKILLGEPDVPVAIRDLGRPIPGMFLPNHKTVTDEEALNLLPPSPPLYDEDTLTDRPERFFASEMIRAALFRQLKKEVPYCSEVVVTEFKENNPDIIRMKATIFVERDSQKAIVVGKEGHTIKRVGMDARQQLEDFFQTKVYLELTVKVDKDWRKNEMRLKELGYLR